MSSSTPLISDSSLQTILSETTSSSGSTPREDAPPTSTATPPTAIRLPPSQNQSSLRSLLEDPPASTAGSSPPIVPLLPLGQLSSSAPPSSCLAESPPKTTNRPWRILSRSRHQLPPPVPRLELDRALTSSSSMSSNSESPPSNKSGKKKASTLKRNYHYQPPIEQSISSDEVRKKHSSFFDDVLHMVSPRSHRPSSRSAPTTPTSSSSSSSSSSSQPKSQESQSSLSHTLQAPFSHALLNENAEVDQQLLKSIHTFCAQNPDHLSSLALILSLTIKKLSKTDQDLFLTQLFISGKHVPFLNLLLRQSGTDLDAVATTFLDAAYFFQMNEHKLIKRIAQHTQCDLIGQKQSTLFRSAYFSSILCKQYGIKCEKENLHSFYTFLLDELKNMRLSYGDFYLLDQSFTNHFDPHDPLFAILSPRMKTEFLSKRRIQTNFFNLFARVALDRLYQLECSLQFRRALAQRRAVITRFLETPSHTTPSACSSSSSFSLASRSSSLSGNYVGEILFLRMICPALATLSQDPQEYALLIPLSKLLNQMTYEIQYKIPFDPSNGDPLMHSLNTLYVNYIQQHQGFLERNSTD